MTRGCSQQGAGESSRAVVERRLPAVSVVMPAFNEDQGVAACVREVRSALREAGIQHQILVVDDGSTDNTAREAQDSGAEVVSIPENRGYGAAIKVGIARADHDTLLIIDADGTYPAESIPQLLSYSESYDMVVGARVGKDVHIPLARRPAKWFLAVLASYLAGCSIPDLNSGLRVLRRDLVDRFSHVLPAGFSFTTSVTLAALCSGALVRFHPIDYRPRVGDSKIRALHAFDFFLLVLRTIVYFNPLRVFIPLGLVFFAVGTAKLVYDVSLGNISETAVMAFLGGVIIWAVGLLSDQIARIGARSWMR